MIYLYERALNKKKSHKIFDFITQIRIMLRNSLASVEIEFLR